MSVSVDSVLLGDIGATNARFSLLSNGNLGAISSFEVAKFGQFTDALAIFIKEHCRQTQIDKALLAIARPVKGERVALTNSSWVIDISELQTVLGLQVRIINIRSGRSFASQSYLYRFGADRRRSARTRSTDGCAGTRDRTRCRLPR